MTSNFKALEAQRIHRLLSKQVALVQVQHISIFFSLSSLSDLPYVASLWLAQFSPALVASGPWSGRQLTTLAKARIHPEQLLHEEPWSSGKSGHL